MDEPAPGGLNFPTGLQLNGRKTCVVYIGNATWFRMGLAVLDGKFPRNVSSHDTAFAGFTNRLIEASN